MHTKQDPCRDTDVGPWYFLSTFGYGPILDLLLCANWLTDKASGQKLQMTGSSTSKHWTSFNVER